MDDLPPDATADIAGALVRSLDPGELARAFRVAIEALLVEIGHVDAGLASRLSAALRELAIAACVAGPPDVASGADSDLVRRGYDALSYRYRDDDAAEGQYSPWLAELRARLPAAGSVLDLGCGCGVPVARELAAAGHQVTGVDISDVQIERARRLVPAGTFIRADATTLDFPPASFDAVVCLYALIHMPLAEQPRLLQRIAGWLRPSGWLLATTGQDAWTGTEDNWLGGQAPMWWSHAGASTYRSWLEHAGLEVAEQGIVPEDDGGHAFFWARRAQGASR